MWLLHLIACLYFRFRLKILRHDPNVVHIMLNSHSCVPNKDCPELGSGSRRAPLFLQCLHPWAPSLNRGDGHIETKPSRPCSQDFIVSLLKQNKYKWIAMEQEELIELWGILGLKDEKKREKNRKQIPRCSCLPTGWDTFKLMSRVQASLVPQREA